MLKDLFWMGIGGLVVYVLMKNPKTQVTFEEEIDNLRNGVHDLVKKYAPEADDQSVAVDVMATVK